jgi:ribosomal-protein-alanine N-acetyltransferase
MNATRLVTLDDVPVLAELLRVNRDFLAPWDPVREDVYFTPGGQLAVVRALLEQHAQGVALPHVIVNSSGRVVGRVTVNNIVLGAFRSAQLGYWVGAEDNGRGHATAAVGEIMDIVFGELRLHRLEAGTLRHNVRSRRVLERNGFSRIGVAEKYLHIAGRWQDHVLFQALAPGG